MVAGQAEVGGEGRQGRRGEEFVGEPVAYDAGDTAGAWGVEFRRPKTEWTAERAAGSATAG